jgi:hypothetical protein
MDGWMGIERQYDYFTFPHQWRPYDEGRRIVLDSEQGIKQHGEQ